MGTENLLRELLAGQKQITERLDRLEAERAPQPDGLSTADGRHALAQAETEPELPDPPPELHDEWASTAARLFENWKPSVEKGQTLDPAGMAEAYTKGGPLWLAAYAHDFLMELPYNWRQIMVDQVDSYAPERARELGRDILRADTNSAASWAYDRGLDQADKRLKGLVEGRNTG